MSPEAATEQSAAEIMLRGWFDGGEPCWISPSNLVLLLCQALGGEVSKSVYGPAMTKFGFETSPGLQSCRGQCPMGGANTRRPRAVVRLTQINKKQAGANL
jgi:hypothetical protein